MDFRVHRPVADCQGEDAAVPQAWRRACWHGQAFVFPQLCWFALLPASPWWHGGGVGVGGALQNRQRAGVQGQVWCQKVANAARPSFALSSTRQLNWAGEQAREPRGAAVQTGARRRVVSGLPQAEFRLCHQQRRCAWKCRLWQAWRFPRRRILLSMPAAHAAGLQFPCLPASVSHPLLISGYAVRAYARFRAGSGVVSARYSTPVPAFSWTLRVLSFPTEIFSRVLIIRAGNAFVARRRFCRPNRAARFAKLRVCIDGRATRNGRIKVQEVGWSLRRTLGRACSCWAQSERKVRASQGAMPDNVRAGRPDGKCHRKYTAGEGIRY